MPRMQYTPQGTGAVLDGQPGVVILQDGTVLEGQVAERQGAIAVQGAAVAMPGDESGLVYFPLDQVKVHAPVGEVHYAPEEAAPEASAATPTAGEVEQPLPSRTERMGPSGIGALERRARARFTEDDWLGAAEAYGELYELQARPEYLDKLIDSCTRGFSAPHAVGDANLLIETCDRVESLLLPHRREPRVERALGDFYREAAVFLMNHDPDNESRRWAQEAHIFANRLRNLGEDYAIEARPILDTLLRRAGN
jgi:hypothetical protein